MVLPHLTCRIGGRLNAGPNTWSIGFKFRPATGNDYSSIAGIQSKLEDWADAIKALNGGTILPERWTGMTASYAKVEFLRTAYVVNGRETAVAVIEGIQVPGGNFGPRHMPSQTALCVSLLSGRPGASNRGRVYLPCPTAIVNDEGRLGAQYPQLIADQGAVFVKALGTAGADILNPGVVPSIVSSIKDSAVPITSVRVGNRLDVQRRRADAEDEVYSTAALT